MAIVEAAATAADVTWHVFRIIFMLVAIVVLVGGVIWMGYVTFWKPVMNPTPTTVQNAQSITNDSYYPDKTVFCLGKLGGFELLSYHSYPQKPIVKETETNANSNSNKAPAPVHK